MMPTEFDPLLPRAKPAPEISGDGYSKTPGESDQERWEQQEEVDDNVAKQEYQMTKSSLRAIFASFTIIVVFAIFIVLLVPGGLGALWEGSAKNETLTFKARAEKIMSKTPLIGQSNLLTQPHGHNDLGIVVRYIYGNKIYDQEFTTLFEKGGLKLHVDIPRLKAGMSGGAFWSAFVGCPKNGTDFSDANYAEDVLRRLGVSYPEILGNPTANSRIALADFQQKGKLISPIGIEGLHQIGNSYSNLRLFESLGARYATLTHNCHNAFADAALITNSSGTTIAAPPLWGGVSQTGQVVVKEMNRIGMLVDLSHVSKDTMIDVLGGRPEKWKGSVAPVIFSHSSAYSLCPHPRNIPDEVLEMVKATNSVVMVNFSPDFISCVASNSSTGLPEFYPPNSTLQQVARHITYIGELIGYDHVGIGSDFNGILNTPKGLEDVSKFLDLVTELLRMGVTDQDAAKVIGNNVLRVWGDAEKTSRQLVKDGVLPAEDFVQKYEGL
ncbi:MAG: hypothetical protein Q9187_003366 [Circinaria calcarea]